MSFVQAFATISLLAIGALFIVLGICALGRCRHHTYWQLDADGWAKRCSCGQVTEHRNRKEVPR